jgi:hypothetical protein
MILPAVLKPESKPSVRSLRPLQEGSRSVPATRVFRGCLHREQQRLRPAEGISSRPEERAANPHYENEAQEMVKPHGFVLNFVGIFDKLEKALAFDSDEINAIVKDLKLLKVLFKNKMEGFNRRADFPVDFPVRLAGNNAGWKTRAPFPTLG